MSWFVHMPWKWHAFTTWSLCVVTWLSQTMTCIYHMIIVCCYMVVPDNDVLLPHDHCVLLYGCPRQWYAFTTWSLSVVTWLSQTMTCFYHMIIVCCYMVVPGNDMLLPHDHCALLHGCPRQWRAFTTWSLCVVTWLSQTMTCFYHMIIVCCYMVVPDNDMLLPHDHCVLLQLSQTVTCFYHVIIVCCYMVVPDNDMLLPHDHCVLLHGCPRQWHAFTTWSLCVVTVVPDSDMLLPHDHCVLLHGCPRQWHAFTTWSLCVVTWLSQTMTCFYHMIIVCCYMVVPDNDMLLPHDHCVLLQLSQTVTCFCHMIIVCCYMVVPDNDVLLPHDHCVLLYGCPRQWYAFTTWSLSVITWLSQTMTCFYHMIIVCCYMVVPDNDVLLPHDHCALLHGCPRQWRAFTTWSLCVVTWLSQTMTCFYHMIIVCCYMVVPDNDMLLPHDHCVLLQLSQTVTCFYHVIIVCCYSCPRQWHAFATWSLCVVTWLSQTMTCFYHMIIVCCYMVVPDNDMLLPHDHCVLLHGCPRQWYAFTTWSLRVVTWLSQTMTCFYHMIIVCCYMVVPGNGMLLPHDHCALLQLSQAMTCFYHMIIVCCYSCPRQWHAFTTWSLCVVTWLSQPMTCFYHMIIVCCYMVVPDNDMLLPHDHCVLLHGCPRQWHAFTTWSLCVVTWLSQTMTCFYHMIIVCCYMVVPGNDMLLPHDHCALLQLSQAMTCFYHMIIVRCYSCPRQWHAFTTWSLCVVTWLSQPMTCFYHMIIVCCYMVVPDNDMLLPHDHCVLLHVCPRQWHAFTTWSLCVVTCLSQTMPCFYHMIIVCCYMVVPDNGMLLPHDHCVLLHGCPRQWRAFTTWSLCVVTVVPGNDMLLPHDHCVLLQLSQTMTCFYHMIIVCCYMVVPDNDMLLPHDHCVLLHGCPRQWRAFTTWSLCVVTWLSQTMTCFYHMIIVCCYMVVPDNDMLLPHDHCVLLHGCPRQWHAFTTWSLCVVTVVPDSDMLLPRDHCVLLQLSQTVTCFCHMIIVCCYMVVPDNDMLLPHDHCVLLHGCPRQWYAFTTWSLCVVTWLSQTMICFYHMIIACCYMVVPDNDMLLPHDHCVLLHGCPRQWHAFTTWSLCVVTVVPGNDMLLPHDHCVLLQLSQTMTCFYHMIIVCCYMVVPANDMLLPHDHCVLLHGCPRQWHAFTTWSLCVVTWLSQAMTCFYHMIIVCCYMVVPDNDVLLPHDHCVLLHGCPRQWRAFTTWSLRVVTWSQCPRQWHAFTTWSLCVVTWLSQAMTCFYHMIMRVLHVIVVLPHDHCVLLQLSQTMTCFYHMIIVCCYMVSQTMWHCLGQTCNNTQWSCVKACHCLGHGCPRQWHAFTTWSLCVVTWLSQAMTCFYHMIIVRCCVWHVPHDHCVLLSQTMTCFYHMIIVCCVHDMYHMIIVCCYMFVPDQWHAFTTWSLCTLLHVCPRQCKSMLLPHDHCVLLHGCPRQWSCGKSMSLLLPHDHCVLLHGCPRQWHAFTTWSLCVVTCLSQPMLLQHMIIVCCYMVVPDMLLPHDHCVLLHGCPRQWHAFTTWSLCVVTWLSQTMTCFYHMIIVCCYMVVPDNDHVVKACHCLGQPCNNTHDHCVLLHAFTTWSLCVVTWLSQLLPMIIVCCYHMIPQWLCVVTWLSQTMTCFYHMIIVCCYMVVPDNDMCKSTSLSGTFTTWSLCVVTWLSQTCGKSMSFCNNHMIIVCCYMVVPDNDMLLPHDHCVLLHGCPRQWHAFTTWSLCVVTWLSQTMTCWHDHWLWQPCNNTQWSCGKGNGIAFTTWSLCVVTWVVPGVKACHMIIVHVVTMTMTCFYHMIIVCCYMVVPDNDMLLPHDHCVLLHGCPRQWHAFTTWSLCVVTWLSQINDMLLPHDHCVLLHGCPRQWHVVKACHCFYHMIIVCCYMVVPDNDVLLPHDHCVLLHGCPRQWHAFTTWSLCVVTWLSQAMTCFYHMIIVRCYSCPRQWHAFTTWSLCVVTVVPDNDMLLPHDHCVLLHGCPSQWHAFTTWSLCVVTWLSQTMTCFYHMIIVCCYMVVPDNDMLLPHDHCVLLHVCPRQCHAFTTWSLCVVTWLSQTMTCFYHMIIVCCYMVVPDNDVLLPHDHCALLQLSQAMTCFYHMIIVCCYSCPRQWHAFTTWSLCVVTWLSQTMTCFYHMIIVCCYMVVPDNDMLLPHDHCVLLHGCPRQWHAFTTWSLCVVTWLSQTMTCFYHMIIVCCYMVVPDNDMLLPHDHCVLLHGCPRQWHAFTTWSLCVVTWLSQTMTCFYHMIIVCCYMVVPDNDMLLPHDHCVLLHGCPRQWHAFTTWSLCVVTWLSQTMTCFYHMIIVCCYMFVPDNAMLLPHDHCVLLHGCPRQWHAFTTWSLCVVTWLSQTMTCFYHMIIVRCYSCPRQWHAFTTWSLCVVTVVPDNDMLLPHDHCVLLHGCPRQWHAFTTWSLCVVTWLSQTMTCFYHMIIVCCYMVVPDNDMLLPHDHCVLLHGCPRQWHAFTTWSLCVVTWLSQTMTCFYHMIIVCCYMVVPDNDMLLPHDHCVLLHGCPRQWHAFTTWSLCVVTWLSQTMTCFYHMIIVCCYMVVPDNDMLLPHDHCLLLHGCPRQWHAFTTWSLCVVTWLSQTMTCFYHMIIVCCYMVVPDNDMLLPHDHCVLLHGCPRQWHAFTTWSLCSLPLSHLLLPYGVSFSFGI